MSEPIVIIPDRTAPRSGDLAFHDLFVRHVDGLIVVDAEGVVRYSNRAAEQMLSTPEQPLVGEPLQVPVPAEGADTVALDVAGVRRFVELRTAPTDWQGRVGRLVSVRDVTPAVRAEQEAGLLTALMRDIGEAATVPEALESTLARLGQHTGWPVAEVWRPDESGAALRLVASWSEAAAGLQAFRRSSLDHRLDPATALEAAPWRSREPLWHRDSLSEKDSPRWQLAAAAGLGSMMAVPLVTNDDVTGVLVLFAGREGAGDERLLQMLSAIARQLAGAVARRLAEDSLARTAAELERRNAELEQTNADLAEFAAVAAHDLRQPLSIVRGYLQTLDRLFGDTIPEQARPLVSGAEDATERMGQLITDLLAYARSGTATLQLEAVDCQQLVEGITSLLAPEVNAASGRIVIEDLPVVRADEAQLEQVLTNLIANAIKFHPPGRPPRVVIQGDTLPDLWCLRVTDEGIGIPEQERAHVFEMFRRLDEQTYSGTGVGLAICRRVVERHGGRIWVEAAPSGGTTVWFTLPREPGAGAAAR